MVSAISVDEANSRAASQLMSVNPVLIAVEQAGSVIPGMTPTTVLHAGPPISWDRACGPMKGAIAGALVYEGLTSDVSEAEDLVSSGSITLSSCHDHQAVGPMAGIITSSMPVFVLEDPADGARSYCNLNEGRGKVMRFGAFNPDVMARLRWMAHVFGPTLQSALQRAGGIPVRSVLAQAVHMGDDCHNRLKASTSLFAGMMSRHVVATAPSVAVAESVLDFLIGNDYSFLNVAMAAQKLMAEAGHGVDGSTLVTAMARNGTDFGIRVSGLGREWFLAEAPKVEAVYFAGYSEADAAPDLGDSAIAETVGFGGFAAAAAPAAALSVGGTFDDAVRRTLEMYEITTAENPAYTIPTLDFRGLATGVDILKVVETGITPVIHTGVAHREAGIGQIGAGVTRAPMGCFTAAVSTFAMRYG